MPNNQPRPIKVLHVAESWGAGVATAVLTYTRHAPAQEHHLLYGMRSETAALPDGWRSAFTSVKALPGGHLRRIASVKAQARAIGAEIVHAHSSFGGAYTRLGLRTSDRRRIIYTPHAYAFEREDVSGNIRKLLYGLEWLLALNTNTFAACSPREQQLSQWSHSASRATYLPNVVDPTGLHLQDAGQRTGDESFLAVAGSGRVGEQKDPDFFIECIRSLRKNGHLVVATWIGGGNPAAEQRLRAEDIAVTGWLDRFTASQLLSRQDLYLHTARWEGFPLAVLEASILGVATVARHRPHFDGLRLPATITAPEQLPMQWERFATPEARSNLVELTRDALAANTAAAQAAALSALYDPAGSGRSGLQASEGDKSHAH